MRYSSKGLNTFLVIVSCRFCIVSSNLLGVLRGLVPGSGRSNESKQVSVPVRARFSIWAPKKLPGEEVEYGIDLGYLGGPVISNPGRTSELLPRPLVGGRIGSAWDLDWSSERADDSYS